MRYLVAVWDGGGTIPAELGVVRRLLDRGHGVTVIGDPTTAGDVAPTGASFRPWSRAPHRRRRERDDDLFRDWEATSPVDALSRLRDRMIAGTAAQYAADVRDALAAEPADVVLADGFLLGAMVGAESRDVPVGVLVPNVYPLPAPGLPPFGSGLAQARDRQGRTEHALANEAVTRLWNVGLPALNAARTTFGLPALRFLWQQWDRAERVLVLTSAAFDYRADRLPDNVVYTGPVLDDAPFVEPYQPPAGPEPLVVVAMSSSYQQQVDALRRVATALAGLPVRAVVTTGPAVDPAEVPALGRVQVVRSAPHSQLVPQAAAVVTHAGHGTLMKALAAGVPTVCMPFGRDQNDNVVRAARHGVAIGLDRTASVEQIADAVRRVLHDPSYQHNAQELGRLLKADAAGKVLMHELEAISRHAPSLV